MTWLTQQRKMRINSNIPGIELYTYITAHQLSWKKHINYIDNKLQTNFITLSKISYHSSFNIAKKIYFGNIESIIPHSIILWSNSVESQGIFKLQKRAIRILCKVKLKIMSCELWYFNCSFVIYSKFIKVHQIQYK